MHGVAVSQYASRDDSRDWLHAYTRKAYSIVKTSEDPAPLSRLAETAMVLEIEDLAEFAQGVESATRA